MTGRERSYKLTDKVVDIMEIDPGWWTTEGLAHRFGCHPDSVKRVLRQLEDDGRVERRRVDLATVGTPGTGFVDRRSEWRLA